MSAAIEGEVVEPETIAFCHPGEADVTRRTLDRRGRHGGTVREDACVPTGFIYVMDGQKIREDFEGAADAMYEELLNAAWSRTELPIWPFIRPTKPNAAALNAAVRGMTV